jgi:hypothetical protein
MSQISVNFIFIKVHMTWTFCLNFIALLESTPQMIKNGSYIFLISYFNPELLQFL